MAEEYLGCESIGPDPDEFLGKRRYKITCRCHRCGKEYSWVTKNPGEPDRPCKRTACIKAAMKEDFDRQHENLVKMLDEGKAPGHIGQNVTVKAIDATADIVMQDHGLTNLKDNIRAGESMAPSLPPPQQKAADNFFNAGAAAKQAGMGSKQAQLLKRRAIAGAFRGMAINPGHVLPHSPGDPALRLVGTERLK